MGESGLKQVALKSMENAYILKKNLSAIKGVEVYQDEIFNEFIANIPCDNEKLQKKFTEHNILGGLYLGDNKYLFATTELNTDAHIDELTEIIKEVC